MPHTLAEIFTHAHLLDFKNRNSWACDRHRRKDNSLREFQKEEHGKRQEERRKKREERENDTEFELYRFLELSTGDNND